jgi:hypothetical protein
MPAENARRTWRDIWLGLLDRLPLSDHQLEPEISADVFVHGEAGASAKVTEPSKAPATDRPESR